MLPAPGHIRGGGVEAAGHQIPRGLRRPVDDMARGRRRPETPTQPWVRMMRATRLHETPAALAPQPGVHPRCPVGAGQAHPYGLGASSSSSEVGCEKPRVWIDSDPHGERRPGGLDEATSRRLGPEGLACVHGQHLAHLDPGREPRRPPHRPPADGPQAHGSCGTAASVSVHPLGGPPSVACPFVAAESRPRFSPPQAVWRTLLR
jgi:hypothetical protein